MKKRILALLVCCVFVLLVLTSVYAAGPCSYDRAIEAEMFASGEGKVAIEPASFVEETATSKVAILRGSANTVKVYSTAYLYGADRVWKPFILQLPNPPRRKSSWLVGTSTSGAPSALLDVSALPVGDYCVAARVCYFSDSSVDCGDTIKDGKKVARYTLQKFTVTELKQQPIASPSIPADEATPIPLPPRLVAQGITELSWKSSTDIVSRQKIATIEVLPLIGDLDIASERKVFKAVRVLVDSVAAASLVEARITFVLTSSDLGTRGPEDIVAVHVRDDGTTEELPTVFVEERDGAGTIVRYHFRAVTSGFSTILLADRLTLVCDGGARLAACDPLGECRASCSCPTDFYYDSSRDACLAVVHLKCVGGQLIAMPSTQSCADSSLICADICECPSGKEYLPAYGGCYVPKGTISPVLWWKLDSLPIVDSSGSGIGGTLHGDLVTDVVGFGKPSLQFVPTTQPGSYWDHYSYGSGRTFISSSLPSSIQTPMITISAWVKPNVANVYQVIFAAQPPGFGGIVVGITPDKQLFVQKPNGMGQVYYLFNSPMQPGVSSHIGVTYDGSFIRLYVAGSEVLHADDTSGIDWVGSSGAPSSSQLYVGGYRTNHAYGSVDDPFGGLIIANSYFFNGAIGDVRVYDRPLQPSEMELLARDLELT